MEMHVLEDEINLDDLKKFSLDAEIMSGFLSISVDREKAEITLLDRSTVYPGESSPRQYAPDSMVVEFTVGTDQSAIPIAKALVFRSHLDTVLEELRAISDKEEITIQSQRDFVIGEADQAAGYQCSRTVLPTSLVSVVIYSAGNFKGSWGDLPAFDPLTDKITSYMDLHDDPNDKTK